MSYLNEMLKELGKEELIPLTRNVVSNCFEAMKPRLVDYSQGESIKIKFPVQDIYLNPAGAMQGGFIAAAFDNAFGLLCFLVSDKHALSLDLSTNFLKPILNKEELIVAVYLKHKGNTLINMWGEAFNKQGQLAATAVTNMIFLK